VFGVGLPALQNGAVANPTYGAQANQFITGGTSTAPFFNDSLDEYAKYGTSSSAVPFNDSLEEYEQYAGSAGGGGRTGRLAN
jgi:hypothetical protein